MNESNINHVIPTLESVTLLVWLSACSFQKLSDCTRV